MIWKLKRVLLFGMVLLTLVGMLLIFKWVPTAIQEKGIRRFQSVEQMQEELSLKQLYLPAYYPNQLQWPPVEIYAQSRPYPLVLIHAAGKETGTIVLALRQVAADYLQQAPEPRIRLVEIKGQRPVRIKGRLAQLQLGSGSDGAPCSRLSWREEGYELMLAGKLPVEELTRMAESMISR